MKYIFFNRKLCLGVLLGKSKNKTIFMGHGDIIMVYSHNEGKESPIAKFKVKK